MRNLYLNEHYRLWREVSTGPRARVYLAEDRRLGEPCALKIRLPESDRDLPAESEGDSNRRGREPTPTELVHFEHPHLAPFLDAGRVTGLREEVAAPPSGPRWDSNLTRGSEPSLPPIDMEPLYFVTPWYGGGDLFSACSSLLDLNPSPEEIDRTLNGWMIQILSALLILHEHSLLHFDVSPRNILFSGEEIAPGIGEAILIDLELTERDSTPLGNRVRGTFPYIAPEILKQSLVDPRADLFSLGASLYHSLDRGRLLAEVGSKRVYQMTEEGRLPQLQLSIESLPDIWADRIERLLSVDPSMRPPSSAELLEELMGSPTCPPELNFENPITWQPSRPIGLEKEIDYLHREVEKLRLEESSHAMILVGGANGIGRQSVAEKLRQKARLEGIETFNVRCGGIVESPFQPIATLLSQIHSHPTLNDSDRHEIIDLIGRIKGDPAGQTQLPPLTSVEEERARWFGRVGTVLERLRSNRGVLVIIEDLHLASPECQELLGIVAQRFHSRSEWLKEAGIEPPSSGMTGSDTASRLLFLTTYDDQSGNRSAGIDILAKQSHVARITLKPLDRTRARKVIQAILGRSNLPNQVIEALHTLSNGLTRPLISLLKECHRQGMLERQRVGWIWVGDPKGAWELPQGRDHRFQNLDAEDRQLLEVVSLVNAPIETSLLESVGRELAIEKSEEKISHLIESGWLTTLVTPGHSPAVRLELSIGEVKLQRRAEIARALGNALLVRSPNEPTAAAEAFIAGGAWDSLASVFPRSLEAWSANQYLASLIDAIATIDTQGPKGFLCDESQLLRIQALRDLGREELALTHVEKWISRHRESNDATLDFLTLRGALLAQLGRLPAAQEQLERAADLMTPNTPSELKTTLRIELSKVLRAEGNLEQSYRIALQTVEEISDRESLVEQNRIWEARARLELAHAQLDRGLNERAAEWLDRFLQENLKALPEPWIAKLHAVIAEIEYGRGRFDAALSHWRESLPIERRTGNYASLATVVISVGRVAYARGNHSRATRLHRLCLQLREQIGDRRGVARVLNNIGLLYRMQHRLDPAERCFRRCLGIFEELGPPDDVAALLGNLADLMLQKGDFPLALEYSLESLDIRKPLGNRRGIAFAYYRIANIYRQQGELDRAADFAQKSLELRRELGDKHNLVYSQKILGDLSTTRANYYEANRSLRQSLALAESLGNRAGRCSLLSSLAYLEVQMGQIESAIEHAEEGAELADSEGLKLIAALASFARGCAMLESEDLATAEEEFVRAEETCRREKARRELAQVLLARTELALDLGSFERAWPLLEESFSIIEEIGLGDFQPTYYRLRANLVSTGTHPDLPVARRLLERGLEEAENLDIPEETWRIYRDLARLEEHAGNPEAAQSHLGNAAVRIQSIHDQLPAEFQGAYLDSASRIQLLSEWRTRQEAEPEPPTVTPSNLMPQVGTFAAEPQTDDLFRLQEITLLLNSERSLQVLLNRILDEVLELFAAERGFLILIENGEERIRAARDIDHDEVTSPEFKYSHSIAREVAKSGRIFLTDDAQHDRRLKESHSVHDLRLQAIACFPLSWREELLGVIYIENRFRKQIVPKEKLRLLEAFSAQAAQAIANARLHTEVVERTKELERSTEEIESLNARLQDRVLKQDQELAEARRAIAEQQEQLEERYRFHHLIGSSEEMRQVFRLLDRIAGTHLPVLIEGESGTGKELAARALHYNSERKKFPFVSENCGAISESLLESELFGHVRGAFTGADRDHEGLFAAAEGGTLFLDEIHQLSLGSQRKLLRVLQEGEYRPVGGKQVVQTDVRVLTASNESLFKLVGDGRFREDLYYRLNVLKVELPPLRQRGRDILILAHHFLTEVVASQGLGEKELSPEALRALASYPFPGNVRELKNVIEKAAILGDGSWIEAADLFFDGVEKSGGAIDLPVALTEIPLKEAKEEFQKKYLEQVLSTANGVVLRAAEQAGITRESLHRLIRKYQLRNPRKPGS